MTQHNGPEWVSVEDETPGPGERTLVYNGVNSWVTPWKPGLTVNYLKFPVTHFARYDLPYAPIAPSESGDSSQRAREFEILANQVRREKGRGPAK